MNQRSANLPNKVVSKSRGMNGVGTVHSGYGRGPMTHGKRHVCRILIRHSCPALVECCRRTLIRPAHSNGGHSSLRSDLLVVDLDIQGIWPLAPTLHNNGSPNTRVAVSGFPDVHGSRQEQTEERQPRGLLASGAWYHRLQRLSSTRNHE